MSQKAKIMGLERRAVVRELLTGRGDLLVITGLGSPSYDAFAAGDSDRNFYLWGAMGGAAVMGLGLAIARPKDRVLVLTGDGEALMGLGGLATIGAQKVDNLVIAVLDNGHYGETGMQASHTGMGVDLAGVARASGFAWAETIADMAGVTALRSRLATPKGPGFATIKISADDPPRALPSRDAVHVKTRFRAALGLAPI